MTVFGVSMMKDEEDICQSTVKHMLTQVDHVIVADNNSSDKTKEILLGFGDSVTVLDDEDPAYYQALKMTALAKKAMDMGADWIVPFDADEIWYYPHSTLKEVLEAQLPQFYIVQADLYNHLTSDEDPEDPDPIRRIGWRWRQKGALPKAAVRARADLWIHQGNHSASYEVPVGTSPVKLVIRHFPYRSAEQFCRKARNGAAAYAATTLDESAGAHWRGYGQILKDCGEEALINDVYLKWFHAQRPRMQPELILDPAPVGY